MELFLSLLINGLSTGMLIFLLAVGLTLIFGLMSVLNFAHGGLFAWGAYGGVWLYSLSGSYMLAIVGAILTGLLLGYITEKIIIKPVYGDHVQQILITLGYMLVLGELLKVVFGPHQIAVSPPKLLDGSFVIGDLIIIKYRVFIILIGLIIFLIVNYILKNTKIGLIVRAGVIDKEMIQALGVNIKKVFLYVFMAGSALAAMSGILLAPYAGVIHADMGMEYAILAFIVVVIGGMGNVTGSLFAAALVGISGGFMAYYVPELSLATNMILMAIVLIFRPQGLFTLRGKSI